jgi:hypothetical protein
VHRESESFHPGLPFFFFILLILLFLLLPRLLRLILLPRPPLKALRKEGLFIHPVIVPRRINANASHEVLDPIHITEDILSTWKNPKILSSIRRGLRDAKYRATTDAETAEKA